MMTELVHYAVDGAVARLTLDSPHNRNALSTALVAAAARRASPSAAADPDVRCVVLGHTGGTFCAGADLSEAAGRDPGDVAADRAREMTSLLRAILELPMPVIGAVDGHVRAGGLGLVGACDIVVAGPVEHVRAHRGAHRRGAVDHLADAAAEDVGARGGPLLRHRREVRRRRGRSASG